MSLLRQIQDAAVSNDGPITELLRRCKILAARLGSAEFGAWVDNELNGYNDRNALPEYRRGEVESYGTLVGFGGRQATNVPIPPSTVANEYREKVTKTDMMLPISHYEDLLANKESGTFKAPWPGDLIRVTSGRVYENMNLIAAWQQIPRGMVVALIDSVRNRVMSFALEIERMAPSVGESQTGVPPVSPERVQHVFQTIIYGNVGNVAAGSTDFSQTAQVTITQNDFEALAQELGRFGISSPEIEELRGAVRQDHEEAPGLGTRTQNWLGQILTKAGSGALKITVTTASNILPRLLAQYFGLPPGAG